MKPTPLHFATEGDALRMWCRERDLRHEISPSGGGEAAFSKDGIYRYALVRRGPSPLRHGTALWIGLNPSTADAVQNDPTEMKRTFVDWGCSVYVKANAYAFRSTDPRELRAKPFRVTDDALDAPDGAIVGGMRRIGDWWHPIDRVGVENDRALAWLALRASFVVFAWGANCDANRQDTIVRNVLALVGDKPVLCLGKTKAGMPRHPLYLRADVPPTCFRTGRLARIDGSRVYFDVSDDSTKKG